MAERGNFHEEHWRIDKRIPLAFLGFIVVQTVLVVWYFSAALASLDARLIAVEESRFTAAQGAVAEANIVRNREDIRALEERTVRSLDEIKLILSRIDSRLQGHERNQ